MKDLSKTAAARSPRSGTVSRPEQGSRASTARLQRLLALVPYVISRNVVSVAEAAAAFGVTERQLVDDLNTLWCVELRAPDPYCPIDLSYEGGEIMVSQADPVARPLRLAADEASALLVGLRMLAEVPELAGPPAPAPSSPAPSPSAQSSPAPSPSVPSSPVPSSPVPSSQAPSPAEVPGPADEAGRGSALSRVIAKLEAAAGEAAALTSQFAVQVDSSSDAAQRVLATARQALAAGRRLHMTYYVPGRDEDTERDVDPMRLLVVDGRTYLEGYCRRAEAVRLFRVDRVVAIDMLDVPAEVPPEAEPRDIDQGLYRPGPDDLRVVLDLAPGGRWVADYYPCESVRELDDGRLRAELRTADPRWVRRLALRLGERGSIVAPEELAAQVRDEAAAALALYEGIDAS